MKLAVVTGTVTATVKDASLVGGKLLLTNFVDSEDTVIESAVIAFDTVGAGVGDKVMVTQGSAARLASGASALPVDACVIAVVDDVALAPVSKSRARRVSKATPAKSVRKKT